MKLWTKFKSLFIAEPKRPRQYVLAFPAEVESEEEKQEIISAIINGLQNTITVV